MALLREMTCRDKVSMECVIQANVDAHTAKDGCS